MTTLATISDNDEPRIKFSFGQATISANADEANVIELLIKEADNKMYKQKASKKS